MNAFVITIGLLCIAARSSKCGSTETDEIYEWAEKLAFENGTALPWSRQEVYYSSVNFDKEVSFYLYTKNTITNPILSRLTDNVLFGGEVDTSKPVIFLIHGFNSGKDAFFARTMREAYLKSFYYNIITIDWSHESHKNYVRARDDVPLVGAVVGQFIDKFCAQTKLRPDQLHVIGHSLGAHISGVAGKYVNSGKLKRITGLDPAGPLFEYRDWDRLRDSSASFVDVIHTCGKGLGFYGALGHVDFYPNHGTAPQPGCEITFGVCSHARAIRLYAESLTSADSFVGRKCDHWSQFMNGHCNNNPTANMGEYVPFNTRGKYWLRTAKSYPYGLGPYATTGGSSRIGVTGWAATFFIAAVVLSLNV